MTRAVQLVDAADANRMRSRAFNLRAHLVQQRRQIDHLGLARAVLQDRLAFGQRGGHQQIFGAGDGDLLEDNSRALEALGAGVNVAVLLGDLCAELLQSLQVQIDGTRADGAASGQRHARLAHASDQRTQDQRGSPHGLDQLVGRFGIHQIAAADGGAMLRAAIAQFDFGAHRRQQLALGLDVAHLRNVFQDDRLVGQQSRGHRGQSGILRAADAHRAQQRIAAANYKLVHRRVS